MANITHVATGQISAPVDIELNSGFYYVIAVSGTFDDVTVAGVFSHADAEKTVKLNKEDITEEGTYVFFSPSSHIRITPTGVGAEVFYFVRMAISPTVTGGSVEMVW